jgi:hypothetical protein
MQNILTLEEELARSDAKKEAAELKSKKTGESVKASAKKPSDDEGGAADRLSHDANSKLNYYLKRTPQYKTLQSQIETIKVEWAQYKRSGNAEAAEKCEALLQELSVKRSRIKGIFKLNQDPAANADKRKEELFAKFRNSDELQGLLKDQKLLIDEIKSKTPSILVAKVVEFRKAIELKKGINGEVIEDFDTVINSDKKLVIADALEQDYYDYCGHIADITDNSVEEVLEMNPNKILQELKRVLEDTTALKERLAENKMKISTVRDNLSNGTNLTDIVFEIFDFKDEDESGDAPREILASANVPLVKSIAYNICSKLGQQNKINDAISYGLLGLTVAINKWYTIQKMSNSALSFKGFANSYIAGSIQRGILELKGAGTASGSTLATIATMNKKKIENFIKYNPEFEDMDKKILGEMLAGYDDKAQPLNMVSESDYTGTVSGDDGDGADIWASAIKDSANVEDYVGSKIEYERLLKSIKDLLNLFETKTDVKTGIKSVTQKKLFNKYDRKLFMMYFGLEYKRQKINISPGSEANNHYTQAEMGEELSAMYAADGITKTFSQASLSGKDGRIAVMLNKIKFAMHENPKLSAGFEFLFHYWQDNSEHMATFSNSREEIGMAFDRQELRQIYHDNGSELNRQLSDGKRLSDVFEISDTNPLDTDIAGLFR